VTMQENKEDVASWLDTMIAADDKTRVVHPTLVVQQYKRDLNHLAAWKAEFPDEAGTSNSAPEIWTRFHRARAMFDQWIEAIETLDWPKPTAEKYGDDQLTVQDKLWEHYRTYKLPLDDDLKGTQGKAQRSVFEADPVAGWIERLSREKTEKHAEGEEPHAEDEDQTGAAGETETEDSATEEMKAEAFSISGRELELNQAGERSSAVQEGVDPGKTSAAESNTGEMEQGDKLNANAEEAEAEQDSFPGENAQDEVTEAGENEIEGGAAANPETWDENEIVAISLSDPDEMIGDFLSEKLGDRSLPIGLRLLRGSPNPAHPEIAGCLRNSFGPNSRSIIREWQLLLDT
jgi:hypothetical protein